MTSKTKEVFKVTLVALWTVILSLVARGAVFFLWPDASLLSSKVIAIPLAGLILTIGAFIMFKMAQKRMPNGAWLWSARERWTFFFGCLLVAIFATIASVIVLYRYLFSV
jgi:hypothetical protein